MSQHENFIGRTFQHNGRLTHYLVVGQVSENLLRHFQDDDEGFFVVYSDGYETYEELLTAEKLKFFEPSSLTFKLSVGVQISNPVERYGPVLIYRSFTDGKIWARHADEFTPDRFTEIV